MPELYVSHFVFNGRCRCLYYILCQDNNAIYHARLDKRKLCPEICFGTEPVFMDFDICVIKKSILRISLSHSWMGFEFGGC